MELARMTTKGQLTVPVSIRRKLGLDAGDQIIFYEKDGHIVIAPVTPSALAAAGEAEKQNHVFSAQEIKHIAAPIAEQYGLGRLSLFGSYARGEATEQSDLDFYASVPENFSLLRLSELETELEDAFHKEIDIVTDSMLQSETDDRLKKNIREDEVLIYGGGQ